VAAQNETDKKAALTRALVDARDDVLALRQVLVRKDAELSLLHTAMRQRDDDAQKLAAQLDVVIRNYAANTKAVDSCATRSDSTTKVFSSTSASPVCGSRNVLWSESMQDGDCGEYQQKN